MSSRPISSLSPLGRWLGAGALLWLAGCSAPEAADPVAVPDVGGLAIDAGVSDAASDALAAPTTGSPEEADGFVTVAEFTGRVDRASGKLEISPVAPDEVRSESLRRLNQGLCALDIVQDGVAGSGPVNTVELVTGTTGIDAACAGWTAAAGRYFCGNVTLRSFYTAPRNDVYVYLQTLAPSGLVEVVNGTLPPGFTSPFARFFSYGNLTASPGPGNSGARDWIFDVDTPAFTFSGSVIVNVVETCNGADDDCDGRTDEGNGCLGSGASCVATVDCQSGLFCNAGTCGAPGGPGYACTSGADCNSGLTCYAGACRAPGAAGAGCAVVADCQSGLSCLSSICRNVQRPAAAGDVVVSEVMARSISGTGDLGEWFELYNPTSTYWDLDGCTFADNNTTNPITGRLILAPGDFLVLGQSANPADTHGFVPDYVYASTTALNNGGDNITITCGSTVIDNFTYTSSSGLVQLGRTMQVDPGFLTGASNDAEANWCSLSTPVFGGAGSNPGVDAWIGTPGAANQTCFTARTIGRCRLQTPATLTQVANTTGAIFGRVSVTGLTEVTTGVDTNAWVKLQAGFGATGSNPTTWTSWFNASASPGWNGATAGEPTFDEYRALITLPSTAGTYAYAYRASGDNGVTWTYCDLAAGAGSDGSEDGFQNANAGVLTVNPAPVHPAVGEAVITEVMVASQSGSPDDGEWVELHNPTATTFNLNGCSISDGTNTAGINVDLSLPPGGYVVLGRSTDTAANFGAPVDFAYGTAFQFNNGGESVIFSCGGNLVDQVLNYPATWEFGTRSALPQGQSVQLHTGTLNATANDSAAAWCNSRSTYGSAGKIGTPGAANVSCNLPVAACRLQTPTTINTYAGAATSVTGRVNVTGISSLTTGNDFATRIVAQVGAGPDGSNPSVDATGWSWTTGQANSAYAGDEPTLDEYVASLTLPAAGSYDFAFRFSGDGGTTWLYCDADGSLTNADYSASQAGSATATGAPAAPTTAGDLVFTEALVSSGAGNTGTPAIDRGEWVEIHNTTAGALNLQNCVLTDGETGADTTISNALVIPAGGYAVFAQDTDSAANGGLTGAVLNYSDSLNLSNSGDNVQITCGGTVIDSFVYPASWVTAGVSWQLSSDRRSQTLNDNAGNWCQTLSTTYAAGRTGTPGAANQACFRCRVQSPANLAGPAGTTGVATMRLRIPGYTTKTTGNDTHGTVQFGIGPDGSNPTVDATGWSFTAATGTTGWNDAAEAGFDQDEATLTIPSGAATFDYAARVSGDGGTSWTWCDRNVGAGSDGSEDGYQPANAGVVTPDATYAVTDCQVLAPTTVSAEGGTAAGVAVSIRLNGLTDATTGVDTASTLRVQSAFGTDGALASAFTGWVNATADAAFVDATNDRYTASLTAPFTPGSYDFAFRVSGDAGTTWTYCDTTGGAYATADAGTLTATPSGSSNYPITSCLTTGPSSVTAVAGSTAAVTGRLQISGLTDFTTGLDSAATVSMQVAWGADGSDPATWTGWVSATGDATYSDSTLDKYLATLTLPATPGSYDFAFRASGDSGATWTYCDTDGGTYAAGSAAALTALSAGFTGGNLVVERLGDGATALSSAAAAVSVLEYTTTGTLVSTISTPFTSADGGLLADSGSASSNGYLNAANGLVGVVGYNSAAGTAGVTSLNTKVANTLGVNRTRVGRAVFPTGGPSATPPSPFSGNNVRSIYPLTSTTFYATGTASGTPNTGGVWYYDGASFTQVSSTTGITNLRNVEVYGGQLFATAASTQLGVLAIGTGLPVNTGNATATFINTGASSSPYGFVIFDTNNDGTLDRAYIADDRTTIVAGGVQRWDRVAGVWTNTWSRRIATSAQFSTAIASVAAVRGLAGGWNASTNTATLYATTTETPSRLISFSETEPTGGGTTAIPSAFTVLATAGGNYVFRGVDIYARCGDSATTWPESCDDGNASNTDACTNACVAARCGDTFVQGTEQCDDGNASNTDACTNACQNAACGDGFVQGTEECDAGAANGTGSCSLSCACSTGFHLEGGVCTSDTQSCSVSNGSGIRVWNGSGYGPCQATSCDSGFHVESNACVSDTRSCSVSNGTGSETWTGSAWGVCLVTSCNSGFHAESNACVSDVRSCFVSNGTGSETWTGSAWGSCLVTSCNSGFHAESNACVSDTRSCLVTGGSGTQTWNGTGWNACVATSCDSGFTLSGGSCIAAGCGNSVIDSGETCDDGNSATEECAYSVLACTVCNSSCQSVPGETDFCTDGVLDPVEFCDDGDTNDTNGCSNTCGCSTGFHQEGGVCASDVRSCSIANGTGTETWNGSAYGLCTLSSCNSGYHANGNACDADVISCSPMPLNTTTGTQTWNGSAYGSCVATACSSGFHVESGVCTSDTRSCSITNGTGTQTWNGSAWGTCIVTACDTGFWPWENTCQAGGNVLVSRVGDGVATLVSTGNAVSLQEYLPTGGTVVSTTTMPTVVGTPNNRLINSGTAGSQGFFGARGAVVALAGYDAPIPTTSLVSATGVNRVGNIFDGNLSVASSTRYTFGNSTVLAGSNLRSIVPLTATTGYIGANNSGVTYYNGASVTSISAGNFRNVEIYNGVLYYSTGSGSAGIYRYATAAPTTTSTPTALFTTSASPYGFVIFDTNVDGTPDTAYVCDDGSAGNGGGLRKYRWDGAAWTNPWRVRVNAAPSTALADTNTEACAGLTGYQANGAVTLFFVTSTASNNRVLSVTDTASSATAPSTSTLVATAGTNLWFRGVDIKGF